MAGTLRGILMLNYRLVSCYCVHCGKQLASRPKKPTGLIVIEGLEPMEYVHAITGKAHCAPVLPAQREAKPYSDWNQRTAWEKAEREEE